MPEEGPAGNRFQAQCGDVSDVYPAYVQPPSWGSPKASHIKASQPHFPHFPRFRVRIFRIFRVFRLFALRNLLRPLFFWGERPFRIFRIFPVSGSNR